MVEVDFSGYYLNVETCQEGDVCRVINEGEYVMMEYKGKQRRLFNLPVVNERTNKELIYSPTSDAGKELVKAWKTDTHDWIGKKFKVKIIKAGGFTKIYPLPIN